jgi:hypothetical protein
MEVGHLSPPLEQADARDKVGGGPHTVIDTLADLDTLRGAGGLQGQGQGVSNRGDVVTLCFSRGVEMLCNRCAVVLTMVCVHNRVNRVPAEFVFVCS